MDSDGNLYHLRYGHYHSRNCRVCPGTNHYIDHHPSGSISKLFELIGDLQVDSLTLPAITICPKVPDSFNADGLLANIRKSLPELAEIEALDLVRFWLGGFGFENMDNLSFFNASYIDQLASYYRIWSAGYSSATAFYEAMQVVVLVDHRAARVGAIWLPLRRPILRVSTGRFRS